MHVSESWVEISHMPLNSWSERERRKRNNLGILDTTAFRHLNVLQLEITDTWCEFWTSMIDFFLFVQSLVILLCFRSNSSDNIHNTELYYISEYIYISGSDFTGSPSVSFASVCFVCQWFIRVCSSFSLVHPATFCWLLRKFWLLPAIKQYEHIMKRFSHRLGGIRANSL